MVAYEQFPLYDIYYMDKLHINRLSFQKEKYINSYI